MGGRGASSGGFAGGGGGGGNVDVQNTASLISERERKAREVDQVLAVAREVENRYGIDANVSDFQIATLGGADAAHCMAYYDAGGNLAVNKNFFNANGMTTAYDKSVAAGFHPSRGNKTGMEAVVAHEMGHRLTDVAGQKAGNGFWSVDKTAGDIVKRAATSLGYKKSGDLAKVISGYAGHNAAEAVAEAFSDVFCNGRNAKRESQAVVNELNKYF